MDILINDEFNPNQDVSSIISDVLNCILDQICSQPPSIQQDQMQMDLEKAGSSSSSSSDDDNLPEKIIQMIEDSDDENANPKEKFCTRNEKKPQILFENESKEQREKRYAFSPEVSVNEVKKKIGIIQSFFENTIVIKPMIKEVLDLDNIIFSKDEILGKIDDVFGNVDTPFYSILVEPYINKKFQEKIICLKDEVFVFEKKVKIILQSSINEIKKKTGCDASNVFDEEICNVKEMEFSDDEMERIKKNKKKPEPPSNKDFHKDLNKNFKYQKEKKYYDKRQEFINRSEHSNEIYNRNKGYNYGRNRPESYNNNGDRFQQREQVPNNNPYFRENENQYMNQNQASYPEYYSRNNNNTPQYQQQHFFGINPFSQNGQVDMQFIQNGKGNVPLFNQNGQGNAPPFNQNGQGNAPPFTPVGQGNAPQANQNGQGNASFNQNGQGNAPFNQYGQLNNYYNQNNQNAQGYFPKKYY